MRRIIRKVNNKLRGAYGMTTIESGKPTKIEINRKRHRKIKVDKRFPKRDRTLINTIVHEEMHARHPKMHEKTIVKKTWKKITKMGKGIKSKLYKKYK